MAEEFVYLPSPGHLPPLPGSHGPGSYLVDYDALTIRPFVIEGANQPVEQSPGIRNDAEAAVQESDQIAQAEGANQPVEPSEIPINAN